MSFWLSQGCTALANGYSMERFEASHTSKDRGRFVMGVGVPALGDARGSGIEVIVSLVVEGNGFEAIFCLLDVGAGSDSIVFEEDRAGGLALGVWVLLEVPLLFRKDFDRMSWAVCSGLKLSCIK